jgi:DNA-3-methyladenine glycosylase II
VVKDIVNKADIIALKRKDNIFGLISERYGDPPNWKREPGFISLSRIILEQQISLSAANAHYSKLKAYVKEFDPMEISKLSDEEMRNCQISRQKTGYLRALSEAVIDRRIILEKLESQAIDLTRKQLTAIKGIGQWTADVYLMFCLQEKDIFPHGDIAVMNAAKELNPGLGNEELKELSVKWKPYRSLAAFYFWFFYLRKRNRSFAFDDMTT